MLIKFLYRCITGVSWRLLFKAAYLWCFKGFFALRAYKKRNKKGILFPPFLFFSLTDRCNLRCRGCWVTPPDKVKELPLESIENAIQAGQKNSVYFYTLLGGEPFLAPSMFNLIAKHPEAYFQVITNGFFLNEENVRHLKQLGNVSPLVSIDGFEETNDARRGAGSFAKAISGCRELQRQKFLYGVAAVVTQQNFDDVVSEKFVQHFIDHGAAYLWFYLFRPVGIDSASELAVERDKIIEFRKRLLELRRKMPIILIDTYWDAEGRAVCPASKGMSFVISPDGSIIPCPPLAAAKENVNNNGGDFFKTVNESAFLRRFQEFIENNYDGKNSQGCVILNNPQELAEFLRKENVPDVSGRDFLSELENANPKTSHYIPNEEIAENYWVYKILKKMLFFGMGAYG
ncbi:radical SAM protein [Planctomycetales bacterium]|nr:radical SAM protein [Planctomycetales bacterium]GHT34834.1 radical SAM protein [Planctomycetales bacterium]